MSWRDLQLRLRALIAPRRLERDLDDELAFHVEMATRKHVANGMPEAEARARARARFGPAALVADACRDVRGTTLVTGLGRDVVYAWRALIATPLATALIVTTLAIGLGLVGAVFNPFSALALHPEAIPNRAGLVSIARVGPWGGHFVRPTYEALRDRADMFDGVSARVLDISERIERRMMHGALVTGNFFRVAGVDAALGRTLTPDDDGPAPGRFVLVLSDKAWGRHFDRDPAVIGRRLRIHDVPYEIVGVAPAGFRGLDTFTPDFWVPLAGLGEVRPIHAGREDRVALQLAARLKPGVSREVAQAALASWASHEWPAATAGRVPLETRLEPVGEAIGLSWRGAARMLPLFTPFVLVLVVGCANVANLLLARAVTRQRELGIRLAMGASRARVVRQLLVESFMLALFAACCAVGVARAGLVGIVSWARSAMPPELQEGAPMEAPALDVYVVLLIVAVACLAAVAFGLLPALHGTRLDLVRVMRGERTAHARSGAPRSTLIAIQVAASAFLLVGASVFLRASVRVASQEPRLREAVVVVSGVGDAHRAEVVAAMRATPGVRRLAASSPSAPMMGQGRLATASTSVVERSVVDYRLVSEHYFETFGIAVRKGRAFTASEAIARAPVAMVSEATALRLWPGREAIGEILRLEFDPRALPPGAPAPPAREATIVGIVADLPAFAIAPPEAGVYAPADPATAMATLSAWVDGDPEAARRLLLERVSAIDPGVVVVASMRTIQAVDAYPVRISLLVTAILGGLALVLTVTGIVGIVSFLVAQRTREIGLRVALGATIGGIARLVVWQSMRPALGGLAAGLGLAWAVAVVVLTVPAMARIRRVVDVLDPAAYALGIGLVSVVCVVAAALPALRGARSDPMAVLRED
jgi:predicted permease